MLGEAHDTADHKGASHRSRSKLRGWWLATPRGGTISGLNMVVSGFSPDWWFRQKAEVSHSQAFGVGIGGNWLCDVGDGLQYTMDMDSIHYRAGAGEEIGATFGELEQQITVGY